MTYQPRHARRRPRAPERGVLAVPTVRFLLGTIIVAAAIAITLIASDSAAGVTTYLTERSSESRAAFFGVVGLLAGVAFLGTAAITLGRLTIDQQRS